MQLFLAGQCKKSTAAVSDSCGQMEEQGGIFNGCTGCLFCSAGKEIHPLLSPWHSCVLRTGRMRRDSKPDLHACVGEQSKQGTGGGLCGAVKGQAICNMPQLNAHPLVRVEGKLTV